MDLRLRLRDYQRTGSSGSPTGLGRPRRPARVGQDRRRDGRDGRGRRRDADSRRLVANSRPVARRTRSDTPPDRRRNRRVPRRRKGDTRRHYRHLSNRRNGPPPELFDQRKWGLIVFDEVHHVPSPIHRRSADLQTKHRLGLTATPTRESDDEEEIFTLIGPPIGTDWGKLFDEGYVAEPEVEPSRPWGDVAEQSEYVHVGHAADRPPPATPENSASPLALAENPAAKAQCSSSTSTG